MPQPDRRRWWALGALLLAVLTVGFDATILNVALPTLATSLHASTSELQWIVDSYVLVFAGFMLPMGVLGDRWGRKRLTLAGLALFALASIAAALTTDPGTLIWLRVVLGLAAAILTPVSMAVIPTLFGAEERGKAVAVSMMAIGAGMPLGPIIGGYLLRHFWWGSIFLINVPVAILAMISLALLLRESRDPRPEPIDVLGGLLSTTGLVGFVYGVIEAPERGWTNGTVLTTTGLGIVLFTLFVRWELRTGTPMIDVGLFAKPLFLWGCVATTIMTFTMMGLLFVLPQYLQSVNGHDALGAGVRLIPLMVGLVIGSKLGERSAARLGPRWPTSGGSLVLAFGLACGALTTVHSGYGFVSFWLVTTGLGAGTVLSPAMDTVLSQLPAHRAGSGIAITMTLRQVGGALGVAALGSLSSWTYRENLDLSGLPAAVARTAETSVNGAVSVATSMAEPALLASARGAYMEAMRSVLLLCAAVGLVGAVLAAKFLESRHGVCSDERRSQQTSGVA